MRTLRIVLGYPPANVGSGLAAGLIGIEIDALIFQ